MAVTHDSPLLARIGAWSLERYPPPITVINIIVYFTVVGVAKKLFGAEVIDFELERDVLGAIAFSCFPLMIRVFDEHKDYEEDVHNHPDRILQRGIITLGHLKAVGAVAIGLQLGISLYLDGGFGIVTQAWLVVMGWSLLMAKEFFLGEWLEKRLFLYAFTHQLVSPMASYWIVCMAAQSQSAEPGSFPTEGIWPITLLLMASGFAIEVSRKFKAPSQERDTVDSYTKALGIGGAVITALIFLFAESVLTFLILGQIYAPGELSIVWQVLAFLPFAGALPLYLKFKSSPTEDLPKKIEGVSGLVLLVMHIYILVALGTHLGFQ